MARLIPVLDILGGRVVRAVGGRRSEYRPVVSRLTDSTEPVVVASKLLEVTGASELYLADLDAIQAGWLATNFQTIRTICQCGVPVWVDAGLREDFDETHLMDAGCHHFVLATETARGATTCGPTFVVGHLIMLSGPDHVALSIDLHRGELTGDWTAWGATPEDAFQYMTWDAVNLGYRRLIVLDTATVGEGRGLTTLDRVSQLKRSHPSVEVWTGGGVRNQDDIRRAADAGADAVLVASALHDGTLP